MKIGIITTFREPYKKQLEVSCDIRLIKFLYYIFGKKTEIIFLDENSNLNSINLIVVSGGNDIYEKSSKNKLRYKVTKKVLNKSFKLKKNIFGICYGAQFIAKIYGSKIIKVNNKKRVHYVYFNKLKKKVKVNSFHDYEIKTLNKNFENLAVNDEGYIEAFSSKEFNFLCVMWHPERNKKFKKIDKFLLKKYLK